MTDANVQAGGRRGARRRTPAVRFMATALVALTFYGYTWMVQPGRPQLTAVFDEPDIMLTVLEDGFRPTEAGTAEAAYQSKRWGWIGTWYDQFHYARMARSLARFELPGRYWDPVAMAPTPDAPEGREVASFSYGLGYPLVGAAFFLLGFRGDPFVVPNGLLFALSAALALALAERFLRRATAFAVVNVLVLTGPFALYFVIPYSTSLSVVAVLACLLVVTGDRFDWRVAVPVAACVGLVFAARYTEAVWLVAILGGAVLRHRRATWRLVASVTAVLAVTAAASGISQDIAFGSPFKTPYHYVHGGLDASPEAYQPSHIVDALGGIYATGDRSILFRVEPILKDFPWAVLAPVGLVILFRRRHPRRWEMLLAAAVGVLSILSYLAWVLGGTEALLYWIIRLHVAWFALWAVLAGLAVEAFVDRFVRSGRRPGAEAVSVVGGREAGPVGGGAGGDDRPLPQDREAGDLGPGPDDRAGADDAVLHDGSLADDGAGQQHGVLQAGASGDPAGRAHH